MSSIATAPAIALGPIVGGWLLQDFSWGSIFVAMAPVAALALAGGALCLTGAALARRGR